MDKSCNSSVDSSALSATGTSSTSNNTSNRDHHYLRQLNKLSHKISKPTTTSSPSSSSSISAAVNQETNHGNLHLHHQPSVYNISKNDFRNVVQKLTGSPLHERISAPPSPQQIHHLKAAQQSSRLHRIRPPPLAHVINNPPSLLNDAAHRNWSGGGFVTRPTAPLSPLPPFPPVHAAAESPVSSYMRYLQSSMFSGVSPLAPLVSPRLCQQENAPPPQNNCRHPHPPSFGCLSSPKSPYGLLSPSLLLSPTTATTVPLPSPKFKGH